MIAHGSRRSDAALGLSLICQWLSIPSVTELHHDVASTVRGIDAVGSTAVG